MVTWGVAHERKQFHFGFSSVPFGVSTPKDAAAAFRAIGLMLARVHFHPIIIWEREDETKTETKGTKIKVKVPKAKTTTNAKKDSRRQDKDKTQDTRHKTKVYE